MDKATSERLLEQQDLMCDWLLSAKVHVKRSLFDNFDSTKARWNEFCENDKTLKSVGSRDNKYFEKDIFEKGITLYQMYIQAIIRALDSVDDSMQDDVLEVFEFGNKPATTTVPTLSGVPTFGAAAEQPFRLVGFSTQATQPAVQLTTTAGSTRSSSLQTIKAVLQEIGSFSPTAPRNFLQKVETTSSASAFDQKTNTTTTAPSTALPSSFSFSNKVLAVTPATTTVPALSGVPTFSAAAEQPFRLVGFSTQATQPAVQLTTTAGSTGGFSFQAIKPAVQEIVSFSSTSSVSAFDQKTNTTTTAPSTALPSSFSFGGTSALSNKFLAVTPVTTTVPALSGVPTFSAAAEQPFRLVGFSTQATQPAVQLTTTAGSTGGFSFQAIKPAVQEIVSFSSTSSASAFDQKTNTTTTAPSTALPSSFSFGGTSALSNKFLAVTPVTTTVPALSGVPTFSAAAEQPFRLVGFSTQATQPAVQLTTTEGSTGGFSFQAIKPAVQEIVSFSSTSSVSAFDQKTNTTTTAPSTALPSSFSFGGTSALSNKFLAVTPVTTTVPALSGVPTFSAAAEQPFRLVGFSTQATQPAVQLTTTAGSTGGFSFQAIKPAVQEIVSFSSTSSVSAFDQKTNTTTTAPSTALPSSFSFGGTSALSNKFLAVTPVTTTVPALSGVPTFSAAAEQPFRLVGFSTQATQPAVQLTTTAGSTGGFSFQAIKPAVQEIVSFSSTSSASAFDQKTNTTTTAPSTALPSSFSFGGTSALSNNFLAVTPVTTTVPALCGVPTFSAAAEQPFRLVGFSTQATQPAVQLTTTEGSTGGFSFQAIKPAVQEIVSFSSTSSVSAFGQKTNPTTTAPSTALPSSNAIFSFGGSNPAPTFGGSSAAPAFGGISAASVFGGNNSTTAFGGSNAAPTFGGSNTAPTFGGSRGTPVFGVNNITPAFGGSNSTPSFGTAQPTPSPSPSNNMFGISKPTVAIFGSTAPAMPTANNVPKVPMQFQAQKYFHQ